MKQPLAKVGIVGASGYAGRELALCVARHPGLQLEFLMSAREPNAEAATEAAPVAEFETPLLPLDSSAFRGLQGLFSCTPHGVAAPIVAAALEAGCKVVDLSADFRLRDPQLYQDVYGQEHAHPELLPEAVYGLSEVARERIREARLVANPGCYPTSILLPLLPLLERDLIDVEAGIICDSKSGVSGAGKAPTETTLFGNVQENFRAYGLGTHRHAPEIAQEAGCDRITFVPHLLPTFRGILSTIYVSPRANAKADAMRSVLAESYAREPFVRIHHEALPELAAVTRTNRCEIGLADCGDRVVIVSCIDNLLKGAAGQALQNMNLMLDLEEGAGLDSPSWPLSNSEQVGGPA